MVFEKIGICESFKGIVELYYKGFDFHVGENAPKLAKQLEKQGIKHTPGELQAFGDLKKYLWETDLSEDIDFIFHENLPEYDEQDEWAFAGSCHCEGGEGQYTSEILQTLDEARYCYIWNEAGEPIGRFYYLEAGQDLAVADLYCEEGHGIYTVPKLLLAIAYGRKYADFVKVDNQLVVSPHGNNHGYWSNLSTSQYSHYSTNPEWEPIHILESDFKGILAENGLEWSENCQTFVDGYDSEYIYCENIGDYENYDCVGCCGQCGEYFSENGNYIDATQGYYCSENCALVDGCLQWDGIWYSESDWGVCDNCGDYVLDDCPFCSEECEEEYNESVA